MIGGDEEDIDLGINTYRGLNVGPCSSEPICCTPNVRLVRPCRRSVDGVC